MCQGYNVSKSSRGEAMRYIEGPSREQKLLFPESIDEYIAADNPVRFVDAFVDNLDLVAAGFKRTRLATTGRPPYAPGDLLKLYIYGYLNRVRSSRKLEQECQRNVEVMWLLRKLKPDHKTIADFRKDNRQAFKEVFKAFCLLCREMELFGGELVAIDGSKFKAVNNSQRNFTKTKVKKYLQELEERIERYLQALDERDAQEPVVPEHSTDQLQAKIKQLQARQQKYQGYLMQMEEQGDSQLSLTDPESRSMPKSPKAPVAYNVQTAVDSKHHLIVAQDVTNEVLDRNQLSSMALAAKAILDVDNCRVVADMGYSHGQELKTCLDAGLEPYVARPDPSANRKLGLYGKGQFSYDVDNDIYRCPAGETLTFRFDTVEKGRHIRYYKTSACGRCTLKEKCTRNKEGRCITRWVHEEIIEQTQQRVQAHPEIMKQRKQIVEHPFGTIKHWWDHSHFLMRGLEKVKVEFSLSALAYNITRVINILGVDLLITILKSRPNRLAWA
jgi:transposase